MYNFKQTLVAFLLYFPVLIHGSGYLNDIQSGLKPVASNACVYDKFIPIFMLIDPICKGECTQDEIGVSTNNCFKWIPETGLQDPLSSQTKACPEVTTEYKLIISDNDGNLLNTYTYLIEVKGIGASIHPEEPKLCAGESAQLEALAWGNGNNYTYLWSNGATNRIIQINQPGSYSVTVTDAINNCQDVATVLVLETSAEVTIESSSTEVCDGVPVELEAIPSGNGNNYGYAWSTGESGNTIQVGEAGSYSVTVTDLTTGCEASSNITLASEDITVAITPEKPIICEGKEVTLNVEPNWRF